MAKLIFFIFLWLLCARFSNAYNISAFAPPSIVLDNKFIVEVEQEIRLGFRLFDASSLNKDSKTIKYKNLQYATNSPNILFPRVVGNKNKLFLYGINGDDAFQTTVMFSFDVDKKVWKELKDVNMPAFITKEENFVGPDSEGYAYLLYDDKSTMLTFNINNLQWDKYLLQQPIPPTGYNSYIWYTATLLPDGKIVYIGGLYVKDTGKDDVPMEQVYVYDTKTNQWYSKATVGQAPGPRSYHSASLTSDGKIIVYGGTTATDQPSTPDLAVLDTTTADYSWSLPQVTNPIGSVYLTPSVIVDNFMVLYVGVNNTVSNVVSNFKKVFMLDIPTYTWYTLDPVAANENENIYASNGLAFNDPSSKNKELILIAVLLGITSLYILSRIVVALYKWNRMRRHQIHQIHPNPQKTVMDSTDGTHQV